MVLSVCLGCGSGLLRAVEKVAVGNVIRAAQTVGERCRIAVSDPSGAHLYKECSQQLPADCAVMAPAWRAGHQHAVAHLKQHGKQSTTASWCCRYISFSCYCTLAAAPVDKVCVLSAHNSTSCSCAPPASLRPRRPESGPESAAAVTGQKHTKNTSVLAASLLLSVT